jgi:hypothetical protein
MCPTLRTAYLPSDTHGSDGEPSSCQRAGSKFTLERYRIHIERLVVRQINPMRLSNCNEDMYELNPRTKYRERCTCSLLLGVPLLQNTVG